MATQKAQFDSASMLDAASYDLSKLLVDQVGFTDEVIATLVFVRDKLDEVAALDAHSATLAKPLTDSLSTSDAASRTLEKLLTSGVGMSDFTEVGDGVAFLLVRHVSNVAFVADTSARQSLLAKSDQVNTTDSGVLVKQDYCDLTYFAEDYVGVARSF